MYMYKQSLTFPCVLQLWGMWILSSAVGWYGVLSCSSLWFLITSAYSLGSWTFLKRHSSSLRSAPRTVGFLLQIMLWHLADGWQRPKAGRGHAIPCCHPINRLLSQLKHRGSRVLSAISLYFECHFVHSRFINAVHASQMNIKLKAVS